MTYLASLHSLLLTILERLRQWNWHPNDAHSHDHDDHTDDFHEIFLFGPLPATVAAVFHPPYDLNEVCLK
ncbi:hypothetical protein AAE026_14160 [Bradyrhizobium sp. DN5]|uniref:hypothetical protein n=1 Tax=Bradyrhizobium sp. DN5 TaxID=3056950 RepID=UPI00352549DF